MDACYSRVLMQKVYMMKMKSMDHNYLVWTETIHGRFPKIEYVKPNLFPPSLNRST